MKVFLYLRVSSEEQAKHGYSLDAQYDALQAFCEKHGHVVVGVYRDEGISGRKPYTKRPAMVQLLRDLEIIKPDMIIFTKLDRWFRNIKEYYRVQDLLDKNHVYWKAINEEYDTSTASGRLYVNIKLSIAQDEADRTSERIKDVQDQLIMQGKVLGGKVPLGYAIKDRHVVFGDNIHITKEAIDHYMLHQSATATAKHINGLYGLNYSHDKILRLFKSPLLKGEYRGNTAYCEPLLTPTEWDDLQAVIAKNIKSGTGRRVYLFTGLIQCPICGRRMAGHADQRGSKRYRCPNHVVGTCSMEHNVSEKKTEKWLLEHIEEDFKVNVTMRPKERRESPKKYRQRLERLNDMYLLGNIEKSAYMAKSADIQRKIAELERQPEPKEHRFDAGWKEVYLQLDMEHRRSFWRGLIAGVEVDTNGRPVRVLY